MPKAVWTTESRVSEQPHYCKSVFSMIYQLAFQCIRPFFRDTEKIGYKEHVLIKIFIDAVESCKTQMRNETLGKDPLSGTSS